MVYDLNNPGAGVRDCPRCRRTMERLKQYNAIQRNEGYLLDDGQDSNGFAFGLFGWGGVVLKVFYRYTLQPLFSKAQGERRQRTYANILAKFPNTLICPHCSHILKRK